MGTSFLRQVRFSLCFLSAPRGSFFVDGFMLQWIFGKRLPSRVKGRKEHVQNSIEEEYVQHAIEAYDLSEFFSCLISQEKLRKVLRKHKEVFSGHGLVKNTEHKNNLKDSATPVVMPQIRLSPSEIETARRMVKMGILQPCLSPSAVSNVFVPKKGKAGLR